MLPVKFELIMCSVILFIWLINMIGLRLKDLIKITWGRFWQYTAASDNNYGVTLVLGEQLSWDAGVHFLIQWGCGVCCLYARCWERRTSFISSPASTFTVVNNTCSWPVDGLPAQSSFDDVWVKCSIYFQSIYLHQFSVFPKNTRKKN